MDLTDLTPAQIEAALRTWLETDAARAALDQLAAFQAAGLPSGSDLAMALAGLVIHQGNLRALAAAT